MTLIKLISQIENKKTVLCVGLDIEMAKMPAVVSRDKAGIKRFLFDIIDKTKPFCVAYKPNIAFFEELGTLGWDVLGEVTDYIGHGHFLIADAKRGDIGNTAKAYAKVFYDLYSFDAVTLSPYMGKDSIDPFVEYNDKIAIVLGLTSNPGYRDLQLLKLDNGQYLFEKVLEHFSRLYSPEQLMFVIGATRSNYIASARKIAQDHFFLMPGIGAQGGDLNSALQLGRNNQIGLLINASRSILYASSGEDYAEAAGLEAKNLSIQMATLFA